MDSQKKALQIQEATQMLLGSLNPLAYTRPDFPEIPKTSVFFSAKPISPFHQEKKKGGEKNGSKFLGKMVGANLKSQTMKLMDQRSATEAEMNAIIEQLCQPGGPGLSGNLVDSEGFPRSDIDVPVVRAQRHRLAELRNDHKEITEKINVNIQLLHSSRLSPAPKSSGDHGGSTNQNASVVAAASASLQNLVLKDSPSANDVDMISSIPFAMVDEIADASPAAEDGLQLGDQIVKFGNVKAGDNLLQRLASEAQVNQCNPIPVIIMRQGALMDLTVTPRPWQGRGLLGCHFRIM